MEKRSSGLTLIELLVAMSILLVGIYAVARGFPALFGVLESERVRTEMARSAEERLEQLKSASYQLPEAIAGHGPWMEVFDPDAYPETIPGDPDVWAANARDDLIWILGEVFEAPAVNPGMGVSIYPLGMGPASIADTENAGDYLEVYHFTRLERLEERPPGGMVPAGYFHLDEQGFLYAPDDYSAVHVDYVWVDPDGVQHGVSDEVVGNRNRDPAALPVRATEALDPEFAAVVSELTTARGQISYNVIVPDPADPADPYPPTTLPAETVAVDPIYGATIALPAADARRVMHVTYQLKTEPDFGGNMRRVLMMSEEFEAPAEIPYQRSLKLGLIEEEPERALFTSELDGVTALPDPVYLLIMDLTNGTVWTENEDWIELDFTTGVVTLDWEHDEAPLSAVQARGRSLRAYYRTIYEHTIAVQKAPAYFVQDVIAATYVDPDPDNDETRNVDYRTYEVLPQDAWTNPRYPELVFPASASGQVVFVDYVIAVSNGSFYRTERRVNGEMHVIGSTSYSHPADIFNVLNHTDLRRITLRSPLPETGIGTVGVLGVQGGSLSVRAWWFNPAGRAQRISIDTFLTPEPLL